MLKIGHVVVSLFRIVWRLVHVVALLLRNVEGWSCSSLVVKKC